MNRLILLFVFVLSFYAYTQTDTTVSESGDSWVTSAVKSWIKISGEGGTYAELYSMSGMASRRPSSTGRIFFRPVITLFDNINIGFDLFLSTEGNSAKQQMDQIGIHPEWSWGQAHLIDFSHEFSRYTLSGINIRGAGVEINPGIFRLHIVGGQTQRAVVSGPNESAYSRYLFGVKIGIGKKESSHFDINIIKSQDELSSVSRDNFMTIRQDSVQHDTGYIQKIDTVYSGVTPQENLIVGTNFILKLLNGKIQLRGEAAGSAYTKDMYSKDFEYDKIPDFATKVFKPKLSSNVDYVYHGEVRYQERLFNVRMGYRAIGPGYVSLGLPSMINDKKILDGGVGFNLFQGILTIQTSFSRQSDNIVKQKLFTTIRNELNITTSVRPTRELMFNINYVNNKMENDANNDTLKLNNVNNAYNLSATYQFSLFDLNHIVLTTYAYQTYEDFNILRRGNEVNAQNVMLNLTTMIGQQWNVSTGFQINTVTIQKQNKSTLGLSARVNNKMFSNKLNNSIAYSFNSSSASTSNNIQIQSMYSINQSNSVALNLRTTIFEGKPPTAFKFFENIASLSYTYRF